ncbi:sulfatase-like hydrolase/transferase [Halosquirtibacter xylanolyticus]|uniref:sulfatase-like hydrolase/transferase n=1 Tax=Halosquirtibacter xylanolyticus TaxID=3374599 RepID=UPI0037480CDE|nr:sulfatase-like hydrolase/transferase [Prolixibacteraceae bacterium]
MKHLINNLTALAFVSCMFFGTTSKAKKSVKTPNIVIIYADDMGYGDVSYQNPKGKIQTPNIDKLASEGIQFCDAHSSSGICSPSRFALLTGQYHWRRMHNIVNAFGKSVFKKDEFTLPRMLKKKGYQTACIGKWHLGWDWKFNLDPNSSKKSRKKVYAPNELVTDQPIKGGPLNQGFDYYFGDGTINFPPYAFIENDQFVEAPTVPLKLKDKRPLEGGWEFRPGPMVKGWDPYNVLPTLTSKMEHYIASQKKNKPFFLYLALPCPHAPIIPNEAFRGKSEAGAYGDFVVQTDDVVGRVNRALKRAGLDDNTIVIFTADNGPEKYAYARVRNFDHRSMGKLRGLKRDTWEGGHRVPFVMKWPKHIKKNSMSDQVISQVDIASTLATIVGYDLERNDAVDSYNLLPLLEGKRYKEPIRRGTVQNTKKDRYAIRVGDWVLIDSYSGGHTPVPGWYNKQENYTADDKSQHGLLFNLKEDPQERNNLFSKYPEKVKMMKNLLDKYREEGRSRDI